MVSGVPDGGAFCYSCGRSDLFTFYELDGVPVHSCVLVSAQEAALGFPTGDIRLDFCRSCGFIQNSRFDPTTLDYSLDYEETQGFSPRFSAFARELAERLIERYDLRGKEVLEIGCGKGEFLTLLCGLGNNRGVGIDPSCRPERLDGHAVTAQMTFILDYYSERYTELTGDLICCRHILEHIQPTAAFVGVARRSAERRPGCALFFEVPDVGRVLAEGAFWDIYHEHCSYFTPNSLARLFQRCGCDVTAIELGFGDQYVLLEATVGKGRATHDQDRADVEALARQVVAFAERCPSQVSAWQERLVQLAADGNRPVLWGSGSKAVAFLTTLGSLGKVGEVVDHVVDINPYRHGKYLPTTGQQIVAPSFLQGHPPSAVIAMNPIYLDEIQRDLDHLGVQAQLMAV